MGMISQKQNNIHWPEEETLPPLDQKPTSTPASSWQGWSLWLRVLGVVVPLVGGFFRAFPIPGDIPLLAIFFLPVLIGVVSAGLFRSWWAMLLIPVAYTVGFYLAGVYRSGTFDYVLNSSPDGILEGTALLVGLGVVPIAIGAAIGIPIGKKIEQRLQH
jgi:hypothetical protein